MPVDMVYLWVDGSDPQWQAKRDALIGKTAENTPINCKGRYADNDELKYSLRSIEKYAPWIRKIFIVTDNQVPKWLDTSNERIEIVDHSEIMPEECRPCFNSCLIEHFLHKIPNLSEHFLLGNDDTLISKAVTPDDFFTQDGYPIVRLVRKPLRSMRWYWREKIRRKPLKNYSKTIQRASRLVKERYGSCLTGMPHHNIDSYLKSDYTRIIEDDMRKQFLANNKNRMRSNDDIPQSILSYIALAEKRGHLRYVTRKESMLVRIHKSKDYARLLKNKPKFFCINDSEYANDEHRQQVRMTLENIFPEKSSFEI